MVTSGTSGPPTDDGVTTYAVETMYARFGHWLSANTTDAEYGRAMVNTYAMTGANTGGLDVTTVNTGEDAKTLTDSSATYSGTAAGMSVEKTTDSDGEITDIQSGAFTATVGLKATFGASPTIGGTVSNFDGPAADPNWSVELQTTAFSAATPLVHLAGQSPPAVTVNGRHRAMVRRPLMALAPDGCLRRLQRPLLGRPCRRGVYHSGLVVVSIWAALYRRRPFLF